MKKLRFTEKHGVGGGIGRDVDNVFQLDMLSLKYWLNIPVVMLSW